MIRALASGGLNHDSASRSQPAFCRSPFNSKIAFGPKQTSTAKPNRLDRSKMTPSRHGGVEIPQRGSLLPYPGVLSFLSTAREASGSETARVYLAHRRGRGVAAHGARATIQGRS